MTSPTQDRRYGLNSSVAIKAPVACATTANITLSGAQTIDGVSATTGVRVLVKDQTDTTENGIYDADTGDWTRALDFDDNRDVVDGTMVIVTGGTTYSSSTFVVSGTDPITVGTDAITFSNIIVASTVSSTIHDATSKTPPVDADEFGIWDSVSTALRKLTWANLKLAIGSWLQVQTVTAFTTGGTSTAYTLTPTPAITANTTNQRFRVKFHTASGTTPTLAVSGQTAKNLKYKNSAGTSTAVTSTQIPANWIGDVEYDGTDWIVLDIPPPATMTATVGGLVPTPPNTTTDFLRGDGTFATPGGVTTTGAGSTSGSAVEFTGLPSGVKSIDVALVDVSQNGTGEMGVLIGTSTGYPAAYVACHTWMLNGVAPAIVTSSTSQCQITQNLVAGSVVSGTISFRKTNGYYGISGVLQSGGTDSFVIAGKYSGDTPIERVKVVSGSTSTFDAGEIGITYAV